MDEATAKTKWCPVPFLNALGSKLKPSDNCIGSACMMWRERQPEPNVMYASNVVFGGYCGLAGKP